MKAIRFKVLLVFCFFITHDAASQTYSNKKNLAEDWLVYENGQYEKFADQKYNAVNTIYFWVDADKFAGDYLDIKSFTKFTLFLNGKLVYRGDRNFFYVDSLATTLQSTKILAAIHMKGISEETLHAAMKTKMTTATLTDVPLDKPATFFNDFVVVAILILLSLLVMVLRLNPKLATDYFSVTKIFSLRETDDNQVYTRITSSTNILFYFFCSLILSFYLMVVFHFVSPQYSLAQYFHGEGFLITIANWMKLSLIILGIFFFKIILVYSAAKLFGSKEAAGIHFFNWVRLLLIVFGIMSLVLFTYFILRGYSIGLHGALLKLIGWCLACWVFIIFLKLNGRTGFSMFHLFSYICVTEIIPLLIIITVLYN